MSAIACAAPTPSAVQSPMSSSFRSCGAAVGDVEQHAEDGEVDRDLPRVAEVRLDRLLADARRRSPRESSRRRSARRSSRPRSGSTCDQRSGTRRRRSTTMSVPEVDDHGHERPEVERDVERLVEVLVRLEVVPVPDPGTRIRWPDEEIGSSSVAPWTTPSVNACQSESLPACSPTPSAARTTATVRSGGSGAIDESAPPHRSQRTRQVAKTEPRTAPVTGW